MNGEDAELHATLKGLQDFALHFSAPRPHGWLLYGAVQMLLLSTPWQADQVPLMDAYDGLSVEQKWNVRCQIETLMGYLWGVNDAPRKIPAGCRAWHGATLSDDEPAVQGAARSAGRRPIGETCCLAEPFQRRLVGPRIYYQDGDEYPEMFRGNPPNMYDVLVTVDEDTEGVNVSGIRSVWERGLCAKNWEARAKEQEHSDMSKDKSFEHLNHQGRFKRWVCLRQQGRSPCIGTVATNLAAIIIMFAALVVYLHLLQIRKVDANSR